MKLTLNLGYKGSRQFETRHRNQLHSSDIHGNRWRSRDADLSALYGRRGLRTRWLLCHDASLATAVRFGIDTDAFQANGALQSGHNVYSGAGRLATHIRMAVRFVGVCYDTGRCFYIFLVSREMAKSQ